ncbi:hypothetical protein N657DRAFT_637206 [Parathielavia appendiculata]|uniref:Uncharacterized protein n=1 Tax=Parathielavia appendiculata TaxID=2587402 RepID=A0AAN6TRW3_9PEZI|nr:hypothetical protein N657DRAFT_637206 [Parathielavia appendiculata]
MADKPAVQAALNVNDLFSVLGITEGGTGQASASSWRAPSPRRAPARRAPGRRHGETPALFGRARPALLRRDLHVASKVCLESVVSVAEKDVRYLNLLVCNAGTSGSQVRAAFSEKKAAGKEVTLEEWRDADGDCAEGLCVWNEQAAATHIAKMLSLALPQWGIRANRICPDCFRGFHGGRSIISMNKSVFPLGRVGTEADMAGQILYLASRAGAYLNGNAILVVGGRLETFPSAGY